jgi:hypothetical protein
MPLQPTRHVLLGVATIGAVVAAAMSPRISQPLAYHLFADSRSWLGIPHCLDVISNAPFLAVGLLGLAATFSNKANEPSPFLDAWERWPYAALFTGVALTSLGSSYYHLAPDNARLVWDRLPMAVGFMGLLTAMLAERISLTLSRRLFGPLLVIGAMSVVYWYWTELQHAGDLRLYLLVQFGSLILVVLLLAFYPGRYPGRGYLVAGVFTYAAAKGLELADREIFAVGHIVSGHTLKHLAAAGGVMCVVAMLRMRAQLAVTRGATWPVGAVLGGAPLGG